MINTEKIHFYFEKTRKQQAKTLALNMLALPFVFLLFLLLVKEDENKYEQLLTLLTFILVIVELGLMLILIWFLMRPARFFIQLTEDSFSSTHPQFKEWTFSVNPQDIKAIEHSTGRDAMSSYIHIRMHNGTSHLLCPNFNYDRKKLYQTLTKINPRITFPSNLYYFPSKSI